MKAMKGLSIIIQDEINNLVGLMEFYEKVLYVVNDKSVTDEKIEEIQKELNASLIDHIKRENKIYANLEAYPEGYFLCERQFVSLSDVELCKYPLDFRLFLCMIVKIFLPKLSNFNSYKEWAMSVKNSAEWVPEDVFYKIYTYFMGLLKGDTELKTYDQIIVKR